MLQAGIAFLIGVLLVQQLPRLPANAWVLLLPVIYYAAYKVVAAHGGNRRLNRALFCLCVALTGFCWALLQANIHSANRFPLALQGLDLDVSGYIASIPVKQGKITRFQFDIVGWDQASSQTASRHPPSLLPLPMRVRLNWYGATPALAVGDHWRLTLRLKAPHGFMNPGGFDYEAWLFAHKIMATGYVRNNAGNQRLGSEIGAYWVPVMRSNVIERLMATADGNENLGVIQALVVGDRQLITPEQWDLFRKTGTSHLVAISGLHIGLIASLAFFVGALIWQLMAWVYPSLGLHCPQRIFQAILALLLAVLYAALAGFSLPTVRALIMLGTLLSAIVLRRFLLPQSGFAVALILVLLLDPFAVNSAGFWLSFSAVAVLLYLLHYGRQNPSRIKKAIYLQLCLILALMPLCLLWFQSAALSSSLANLLAIPLVSFLLVPMSLLGTALLFVLEPLGLGLLQLTDSIINVLMGLLLRLAEWPLGQWVQHKPFFYTVPFAVLGIALLLSPRGLPARYLAVFLLMPLFFVFPERPKPGEAWFTLLDVGQGLSAVVQTQHHVLVFDSGAKFSDRFDIGSAVLIPYLRERAIKRIDTLIISHSDNDHIGGATSLLKAFAPTQILSGEALPQNWSANTRLCRRGQRWVWDQVLFEIIYPAVGSLYTGNNASCVLKVTAGQQRLLITGDIEQAAELELTANQPGALAADILLAPHHGSRTSSSTGFIDRVRPKHTLFAVGYRNRYGFPKSDIVQRYIQRESQVWLSHQHGAIGFQLSREGLLGPLLYRDQHKRYWHYTSD